MVGGAGFAVDRYVIAAVGLLVISSGETSLFHPQPRQ